MVVRNPKIGVDRELTEVAAAMTKSYQLSTELYTKVEARLRARCSTWSCLARRESSETA